jgi:hypothetical protein
MSTSRSKSHTNAPPATPIRAPAKNRRCCAGDSLSRNVPESRYSVAGRLKDPKSTFHCRRPESGNCGLATETWKSPGTADSDTLAVDPLGSGATGGTPRNTPAGSDTTPGRP